MSIIIYKKNGPVISLVNVKYIDYIYEGYLLIYFYNNERLIYKTKDIKQIKIMEE